MRLFFQLYEAYDEEECGSLEGEPQLEGFIEPDSARIMSLVDEYHEKVENEK